jgi:hypothetical protein
MKGLKCGVIRDEIARTDTGVSPYAENQR